MKINIDLIFTRDFSLAVSEWWQGLLSHQVKDEFGAGIERQINRYNGRTSEFYRCRDELSAMKKSVLSKSLDDPLFSETRSAQFRKDVDAVRHFLKQKFISNSGERVKHFKMVIDHFSPLYPAYMLGVFLPNVWREDFIKIHKDGGEEVIKRAYENRTYSEGLLKEVDLHCCESSCILLEKIGVPSKYAKALRLAEMMALIGGEKNFKLTELEKRSQGYIFYGQEFLVKENFDKFLQNHDLVYESPVKNVDDCQEIVGQVASKGKIIRGQVQIILNSVEINNFKKGNILITPMTSPDYLKAMRKAAAIVTDTGGLTCHAAVVSRELNVPCIIGTKYATKLFKDGDKVIVCPRHGYIKFQ